MAMPQTIRLTSPDGHYIAEIIPEAGAILSSLRYQSQELIDCPYGQPDWSAGYPSAVLYPFPNRINQGTYRWRNQTYQIPINEVGRNHALHGLVWNQPFDIVQSSDSSLVCAYQYTGQVTGYPFPFQLVLNFLVQNTGLTLHFNLTNEASVEVPAAWGWHPYFTFSDQGIDSYSISLPKCESLPLSDAMIPNFDLPSVPIQWNRQSLKGIELDQVYRREGHTPIQIELENEEGKVTCQYSEEITYFTLYTPPHRKSIAIEPQTSHIDSFNNQQGLWVLKPQEKKSGQVTIQYTPVTSVGETR